MTETDAWALARADITRELTQRTGALDLRGLGLQTFPPELWDLKHLTTLHLGGFAATAEDYNSRGRFVRRKSRGQNKVAGNIFPIRNLHQLKKLDLSNSDFSNLSEIEELENLMDLDISNTKIDNLKEIIKFPNLEEIDASDTNISDLSPVSSLLKLRRIFVRRTKIRRLSRGIGNLRRLSASPDLVRYGLFLEGNKLEFPFSNFVAQGNPAATRSILTWLRGELDQIDLPNSVGLSLEFGAPPDIPPPGPGLHVAIRSEDGVIDFAPPEALDQEGNNRRLLETLHPELRKALSALRGALGQGNKPPSELSNAVDDYAEIADRQLADVDFALLYARGVRLRNASAETRAAAERGVEPDLSIAAGTSLRTLLDLHGALVGATKDGVDLSAAEEVDETTPEERRSLRAATIAFAEALKARGHSVVSPAVAAELLASAMAAASGPNPARSTVVAGAQARQVIGSSLAIAGVAVVGMGLVAASGPAVGPILAPGIATVAALYGIEPIKNSAGYAPQRDFITRLHDRGVALDVIVAIMRRHRDFAVAHIAEFDALARLNHAWNWLGAWVTWLQAEAKRPRRPEAGDE